MKEKISKKIRRKIRVRARVFGTKIRPRLSVFRSNKHIYAQIVDDTKTHTLVSASDLELKQGKGEMQKYSRLDTAFQVGELLAEKALKRKLKRVVFDRG